MDFIRDLLVTNVTDPVSASRAGTERFVMTSYPKRAVRYPIITVIDRNISIEKRSGLRSESQWTEVELEVRIWARNTRERDNLSTSVFDVLRTNEYGSGSTSEFEMHDFRILSAVNFSEEGEHGIKSKIIRVRYKMMIG